MNIVLGHFALSEVFLINTMFPDFDQFLPADFIILIFFYFEKPTSLVLNHNYRRTKIFILTAIEAGFQTEHNLNFFLLDIWSCIRISENYANEWIQTTTDINDVRTVNLNLSFSFFLFLRKFMLKIKLRWNLKSKCSNYYCFENGHLENLQLELH